MVIETNNSLSTVSTFFSNLYKECTKPIFGVLRAFIVWCSIGLNFLSSFKIFGKKESIEIKSCSETECNKKQVKEIFKKQIISSFFNLMKEQLKNYSEEDYLKGLDIFKSDSLEPPMLRLFREFLKTKNCKSNVEVDDLLDEFINEFNFFDERHVKMFDTLRKQK